jgi:hypothetical protein
MRVTCAAVSSAALTVGPEWLHEIKHDGYRILAHHDGERVRLISRRGLDWGWRFPTIVAAIKALAVRSCIVERSNWKSASPFASHAISSPTGKGPRRHGFAGNMGPFLSGRIKGRQAWC